MTEMTAPARVREIPYNYTSLSDREIVIRLLGEKAWDTIESLRGSRRTGRSARMLFEVLGDIWAVERNPYLVDDLIVHPKRRKLLVREMSRRLEAVRQRAEGNADVLRLVSEASAAVCRFDNSFPKLIERRAEVKRRLSAITDPDNIRFDGFARVTHVTDATDWRIEIRSSSSRPTARRRSRPSCARSSSSSSPSFRARAARATRAAPFRCTPTRP